MKKYHRLVSTIFGQIVNLTTIYRMFTKSISKSSLILALLSLLSACTLNTPQINSPAEASVAPVEQIVSSEAVNGEPAPVANETLTKNGQADKAVENGLRVAARVNDQPIFEDAYQKQVTQFKQSLIAQGVDLDSESGQAQLAQIRQQVLNTLVDQVIIEQAAERQGISLSAEQLEAKAQESAAQGPDRAQFEAWLAANNLTYDDFKETLRVQLIANQLFEQITSTVADSSEQIQLRQILVADEATAKTIIEQLKNGADFAELAQTASLDESSRDNGGALGWVPHGIGLVPPEVEAIAFSVQPPQVSGPIPSPLGFHIIQVQAKETERPLELGMLQALKEQYFITWLTEQRSASTIEKFIDS